MNLGQLKNSGFLFAGQLLIKSSGFLKQIILAFYLGLSYQIDLLLIAQIIPSLIASMISGSAGEIIVTTRKTNDEYDNKLISLLVHSTIIITILLLGIYLIFIKFFLIDLFYVQPENQNLFWELTWIVVLSKIPASYVSSLQHILFAKGKYKFFVFASLISEIIGLFTIFLFVNDLGILSFTIALMTIAASNALFLLYAHKIEFWILFNIKEWKNRYNEIIQINKKIFFLSAQTLINQLTLFTERFMSFWYLQPGYLSALNYSKNLTQLPQMVMLSSILTTTYVEQNKKSQIDYKNYKEYSAKMYSILIRISIIFQYLSLLFGPLILIVFFRRGAFDNEDVKITFDIYQILSLSFVPSTMISFLSRTLYIENKYKLILKFVFLKFIIETLLIIAFINNHFLIIPISLVIGKFILSFALFSVIKSQLLQGFNWYLYFKDYFFLLVFSLLVLFFNQFMFPTILKIDVYYLILIYIPVAIMLVVLLNFYLKKKWDFNLIHLISKKSIDKR